MTDHPTTLNEIIAEEVEKYRGVYVPIRSSLLRRLLIRRLPCAKVHPNPDDEFCKPGIGPNYAIIANYREEAKRLLARQKDAFEKRLVVQRISPDGYMLLNGHHRWAAAITAGISKVPVRIVNLTQEMDIKQMLWHSKHSKRATLDLDEVVFAADADEPAEKGLPFPFSLKYTQRLRRGIPALFRFLNINGYDVWVYSKSYHSLDSIKTLFRLYHVQVTGIVTGVARKQPDGANTGEALENMLSNHYEETLFIDREALLRVDKQTRKYEEYSLSGPAVDWSAEIMDRIERLDKHE